jgi:hypothetical protein
MSIAINTSTVDLCLNPDITYLSDSESADPLPPLTSSPSHTLAQRGPRIPLVSFSYGPFRVWRTLGEGVYATAIGVQAIASNCLLCLKVFQNDCLKYIFTEVVLLNELDLKNQRGSD